MAIIIIHLLTVHTMTTHEKLTAFNTQCYQSTTYRLLNVMYGNTAARNHLNLA